ncbi:hypothetical protein, partial [Streptomyces xanthophaeus]|uniref:hypothetical protein n=1 Tax=Streptomyces xanthophaeus TaxID=67385 RepID=UPI0036616864
MRTRSRTPVRAPLPDPPSRTEECPHMDDLDRLAALHGIATAYQPAADVTVRVPQATVTAVLGLIL